MDTFWKLGVRAPFLFIAAASLALSAAGVADWSLGLTGLAFGAVVAAAANRLHKKIAARERAQRQAHERATRGTMVTGRFQNLDSTQGRSKAA